jgi:hypothetical protein
LGRIDGCSIASMHWENGDIATISGSNAKLMRAVGAKKR